MMPRPKLTICVPSRNRQVYFKQTIVGLVSRLRTDIEFVFADNSSDPSIMNDFMVDIVKDPRVRFIPSQERVLSMPDNWERCIEVATGDWICVVGDDDYVDPDVADLLIRIEDRNPLVDCVTWARIDYFWPNNRRPLATASVSLDPRVHDVSRYEMMRALFMWEKQNVVPACPFSIYHGAVTKRAMDLIKSQYGGRYFEHNTLDFEMSAKLLISAGPFVYSQRPFSVTGASPESNSAAIGNVHRTRKALADAMAELGRNIDDDPYMEGFPFPATLGVTAAVAQCLRWFGQTYGYTFSGWEENFAKACASNCYLAKDRESFDLSFEGYHAALSLWHQGRYLPAFEAGIAARTFVEDGAATRRFIGITNGTAYMAADIGGAQNPTDLYTICNALMGRVEDLDLILSPHGEDGLGHQWLKTSNVA